VSAALQRCRGSELSAGTLYELLRLRVAVFVVEQNCPYSELDGGDLLPQTRHFWLCGADGEVIAIVRLMEESPGGEKAFRIGRVCTAVSRRGQGHSRRLMQAALAEVGDHACHLNAQTYLTAMYGRHGFTVAGPEFLEDGIAHVAMVRAARR
jgi:ElaA protein